MNTAPSSGARQPEKSKSGSGGLLPDILTDNWEVSMTCVVMLIWVIGGLLVVWHQPMTFRWTALLWALACCVAGSLPGFLFSIPHSSSSGVTAQSANTNLVLFSQAKPPTTFAQLDADIANQRLQKCEADLKQWREWVEVNVPKHESLLKDYNELQLEKADLDNRLSRAGWRDLGFGIFIAAIPGVSAPLTSTQRRTSSRLRTVRRYRYELRHKPGA
jgi:hypothetical protein